MLMQYKRVDLSVKRNVEPQSRSRNYTVQPPNLSENPHGRALPENSLEPILAVYY